MPPEKRTLTAPAGQPICYWKSGSGPPLLLVHGALADHETAWARCRDQLERRFTVFAMDRRGRGCSGEPMPYTIGDAFADICAVVDAIGARAYVVAHSFGATCALGAAMRSDRIRKLIAYEPVPPIPEDPKRTRALMRAAKTGDADGFIQQFLNLDDERAAAMKSTPQWATWCRFTLATAMDLEAFGMFDFDASTFSEIPVSVLLLSGERSPRAYRDFARDLADSIPGSNLRTLDGLGHFAMDTAPEVFAAEVERFYSSED